MRNEGVDGYQHPRVRGFKPHRNPYQAYVKAVTYSHHGLVCDQNIHELRRVYNRKFPDKIPALERFLAVFLSVIEGVQTPVMDIADEFLLRDGSDRPILRTAVKAQADILITGDKDCLESGIPNPKIMTALAFGQME